MRFFSRKGFNDDDDEDKNNGNDNGWVSSAEVRGMEDVEEEEEGIDSVFIENYLSEKNTHTHTREETSR